MRKYGVIYRSVLMENLQYIANIALGFVSYFIFIFVCRTRDPDRRLYEGADDMVRHDHGDDLVWRPVRNRGKAGVIGYPGR